jgi:hypothetical protein
VTEELEIDEDEDEEQYEPTYTKPSSLLEDDWLYWWILKNWHICSGEFQGERYKFFPHYPFLEAYAKDKAPRKVAMKSAQAGVTEINIATLFAVADTLPGNSLYVMPTHELADNLARARLKKATYDNPYLEENMTGFDTLSQFEFKGKSIYIRGSQTQVRDGREYQRQLISIDISKLYGDEVDEWNGGVLPKLMSRLGASLDPYESYFSTPRMSDGQTERLFNQSDQKYWGIKCRKCNEWNVPLDIRYNVTNFEYPDLEHKFICRYCERRLNRLESHHNFAQWVAQTPSVTNFSGYHFSKLFTRAGNIDQIVERYNDPEQVQECYNDDLGIPYTSRSMKLEKESITKCACDSLDEWADVVLACEHRPKMIGIDMGKVMNYNIRTSYEGMDVILEFGAAETFEELKMIIMQRNVRQGVLDAQPDFRASLQFCEEMSNYGDFKVAYYDTAVRGAKDRVLVRPDGMNEFIVHIGRNFAMSKVMFEITSKTVMFPPNVEYEDNGEVWKHLTVPERLFKKDSMTGANVMYFPATRKPDHYYHSLVYSKCSKEMEGENSVEILKNRSFI